MRNRTTVSCAAMLAVAILAFAMSARAHTPSCVLREDHELAKRDLNELNAKIWDFKAKHTATTGDLEDIAKAAEKSKSYQGCPKCSKCPKRRRELLSQPVCLSPSEYREHLALGKEIESAKDKLKEVEHEYSDVRKDFRKAKKAYCLCDPCHAAPSPTAPSPTSSPTSSPTEAVTASFDPVRVYDTTSDGLDSIYTNIAIVGDSITVGGYPQTELYSYNANVKDGRGLLGTSNITAMGSAAIIAFHPVVQEEGTKTVAVATEAWGTKLLDLNGGWQSASRSAEEDLEDRTNEEVSYPSGVKFTPFDVAWNPAGTQLATATGNWQRRGVDLYEYNAGVGGAPTFLKTLRTLDSVDDAGGIAEGDVIDGWAQHLAFSLDGAKLATIGEGSEGNVYGATVGFVMVWETESPYARLATVNLGATVRAKSVTWTANNLVVGYTNGSISVYVAAPASEDGPATLVPLITDDAPVILTKHTSMAQSDYTAAVGITELSTSSDGSLLASADGSGNVIVWSCATWSALRTFPPSTSELGNRWVSLAFSPTAPLLVASFEIAASYSVIALFNTEGWSSYDGDVDGPMISFRPREE